MDSFPKEFLWGSATASYQIEGAYNEGGKSLNIWDVFSHKHGTVERGENGDVACDHYHRFEEDIKLMAKLGVNAYRFSISWSRIVPNAVKGSAANSKGIEFYNKIIDLCLEHGVQPLATLYHWDLPQTLEEKFGGFLSRDFVECFVYYAGVCFKHFGDRVKKWLTFNEPWCICALGFGNGVHAPGKKDNGGVEPYIAAHHLLLAHAETYNLYCEQYKPSQKGVLGITLNSDWVEPVVLGKDDDLDIASKEMALKAMDFSLGWFAEPVFLTGDYPAAMKELFKTRKGLELVTFTDKEKAKLKGSSDYFGLNHYSTSFVYQPSANMEKTPSNNYFTDSGAIPYPNFYANEKYLPWERVNYGDTDMGWKIVPYGFRNLINFIHEKYHPDGGIIITENGCAMKEESVEDASNSKGESSKKRIQFYEMYIKEVKMAINEGSDVRGYFLWSFMDNFEWSYGYEKRFGLVHVDYKTLERTPKPAFEWYKNIIKQNRIALE